MIRQPNWGGNRVQKSMGDEFIFGNLSRWDLILAASTMAHQGKHTPLLLVEKEYAPPVVLQYLQYLKPPLTGMHPMPPFMHGFILGTRHVIDLQIQADIEEALKIDEQPKKNNITHPHRPIEDEPQAVPE